MTNEPKKRGRPIGWRKPDPINSIEVRDYWRDKKAKSLMRKLLDEI